LKDFGVVVLFTVSAIAVWLTPFLFFAVSAFETSGRAGLYFEWLALVPAGVIIVIWTFVIRRSRRGR
jgi:hypothetical protein